MVIQPKVRGFLCTTTHPTGCFENVRRQAEHVRSKGDIADGPKRVLVLGASTGYGLASRITAAFGSGASTIGADTRQRRPLVLVVLGAQSSGSSSSGSSYSSSKSSA